MAIEFYGVQTPVDGYRGSGARQLRDQHRANQTKPVVTFPKSEGTANTKGTTVEKAPVTKPKSSTAQNASNNTYEITVKKGDCMWNIAKAQLIARKQYELNSPNVSAPTNPEIYRFMKELIALNGLILKDGKCMIHPNQKLKVPRVEPKPSVPDKRFESPTEKKNRGQYEEPQRPEFI